MDIIRPTTKNRMAARPQSRGQSHRRAYLDTYAQQSRGEVAAKDTEVSPAQQIPTSLSTPELSAVPPVNTEQTLATTTNTTPQVVERSPAAESQPGYTPLDTVKSAAATQSVPTTTPQQAGNYLDVLVQRHAAAVAEAPEQLETVTPPTKDASDAVFVSNPDNQKENAERLEVNLRALYEDSLIRDAPNKPKQISYTRAMATSAFACGILAVGIFTFFARVDSAPLVAQPVGSPVIEVEVPVQQSRPRAQSQSDDSRVASDPSHPVRIVASEAGINAPVIGLGITPDGLIDVPEAYGVVGWYNKGVVPGKPGPAVIVGHYTEGLGGAFDNLYQLKKGDLITVTNGRGQNFTYKLTAKKEYDKDKVPMEKLFEKGDGSRLEIITCAGKWQADNYDKRLVVTAELVR